MFKIKEITEKELSSLHWELLLEADPSQHMIRKYLEESILVEMRHEESAIGIMVMKKISQDALEIKNIAILSNFQNKGLATRLLMFAIEFGKKNQYKEMYIGTGTTSFQQLYLYQKVGFRVDEIKKDFFTEAYDTPIIENKLLLRDMLILKLIL